MYPYFNLIAEEYLNPLFKIYMFFRLCTLTSVYCRKSVEEVYSWHVIIAHRGKGVDVFRCKILAKKYKQRKKKQHTNYKLIF